MTRMKRSYCFLSLFTSLMLALSACGGSGKPDPTPTLTSKVTDHTTDVLQALKSAGVEQ